MGPMGRVEGLSSKALRVWNCIVSPKASASFAVPVDVWQYGRVGFRTRRFRWTAA